MKERISCFDIDGTLSRGMVFVPLMESEHKNGYIDDDSFNAIQALLVSYKTGEIEYEFAVDQLLQTHADGLRGKGCQDLRTHAEHFLLSHEQELFHTFGRKAIQLIQARHPVFVVTAEPQYVAEAIAKMYGANGWMSSVYSSQNGMFDGAVERSLADRSAKSSVLEHYAIEHAFGDSEGDIDMLSDANYPYCISPTEGLITAAKDRNWNVYDGDDEASIIDAIVNNMGNIASAI